MDLQGLLIFAPVLLFSVIAHEYAHGYAALKQGDDTALVMGRLTWNPIRHIDPFMTIILPLVLWLLPGDMLLAGAKPVPTDPRRYRNYRRGDIIVSLAGVAANLLIAIACAILLPLLGLLGRAVPSLATSAAILQAMMFLGILLNCVLIVFNLLPIPPLDGSHVVKHLLPGRIAVYYQQVARYGVIVLIAAMWIAPGVLRTAMTPAYAASKWATEYAVTRGLVLPGTSAFLSR